jgi:hypothetical protein
MDKILTILVDLDGPGIFLIVHQFHFSAGILISCLICAALVHVPVAAVATHPVEAALVGQGRRPGRLRVQSRARLYGQARHGQLLAQPEPPAGPGGRNVEPQQLRGRLAGQWQRVGRQQGVAQLLLHWQVSRHYH